MDRCSIENEVTRSEATCRLVEIELKAAPSGKGKR
jgi:hypothetical protein